MPSPILPPGLEELAVALLKADETRQEALRVANEVHEQGLASARAKLRERLHRYGDTCNQLRDAARENETKRLQLIERAIEERRHEVESYFAAEIAKHSHSDEDVKEQAQEAFRAAHWMTSAMFEGAENLDRAARRKRRNALAASKEKLSAFQSERERLLASHPDVVSLAKRFRVEMAKDKPSREARELTEDVEAVEGFLKRLAAGLALRKPSTDSSGNRQDALAKLAVEAAELDIALRSAIKAAKRESRFLRQSRGSDPTLKSRDEALRQARQAFARTIRESREARERSTAELNARREAHLALLGRCRERAVKDSADRLSRRIETLDNEFGAKIRSARERCDFLVDQVETEYRGTVAVLNSDWDRIRTAIGSSIASYEAMSGDSIIPWTSASWSGWTPPTAPVSLVQFGTLELASLSTAKGDRKRSALPVFLPMTECANLIVEADGQAPEAIDAMNAVMMRLLTSLPPAKVRFTILDPVSRGKSFAGFMHLADFDEALVSHRIWTEPEQIESRLAELTDHIEKVFQHALRGEFRTIQEFNAAAGEVAEAFRVLVIADFPTGFEDGAIGRLNLILERGPQCGIITLLALDPRQKPPQGFERHLLRRQAVVLTHRNGRFRFDTPLLHEFSIGIDPSPETALATRLLRSIGAAAVEAGRIEVPFDFVIPSDARYWASTCRDVLIVPVGKVGATKIQELRLGEGIAQHALIAGRTGTGKSTLLHVLITNIALIYSPDEVELYLIDFKRGVEFKTYVEHQLPHARVIAVESEREFGVSVLERLDRLIQERGNLFRACGVHNLAGYRAAYPDPLPRAVLIIDEFQELFIESDKLALKAATLLDRLARQGRAFGIHVVLGSQSLLGTATPPRATLGQIGIRIAFQCSDSESQLILSTDNSAARRLSRPGEAVYNDSNGNPERNQFFQVAWLPDTRRDACLAAVAALAENRLVLRKRSTIVFEGNVGGVLESNVALACRIDAIDWPSANEPGLAWLGEPIAIKEPTAVEFRPMFGNHLLIVGLNSVAALGIVSATMISLSTRYSPAPSNTDAEAVADFDANAARFILIDGTLADSSHSGLIARVASAATHHVESVASRDAASTLRDLVNEIERRSAELDVSRPRLFLFLHELQRLRSLRRTEEMFRYSSKASLPTPAEDLTTLLRDGPLVGLHVVASVDSLGNLMRTADRGALSYFGHRVVLQMSQDDSSKLIEGPYAGKLGPHRAYYFAEGGSELEKFRPYHPPSQAWLDEVMRRMQNRRRRPEKGIKLDAVGVGLDSNSETKKEHGS